MQRPLVCAPRDVLVGHLRKTYGEVERINAVRDPGRSILVVTIAPDGQFYGFGGASGPGGLHHFERAQLVDCQPRSHEAFACSDILTCSPNHKCGFFDVAFSQFRATLVLCVGDLL